MLRLLQDQAAGMLTTNSGVIQLPAAGGGALSQQTFDAVGAGFLPGARVKLDGRRNALAPDRWRL